MQWANLSTIIRPLSDILIRAKGRQQVRAVALLVGNFVVDQYLP